VENAVGADLCNSLLSVEYEITYWREGNQEVDYLVARGRDIWAIEVKSGRSGKAAGLTRFRERYPEAKALLVGGQGIPLDEFFSRDPATWLV
jgi:predicted AAA+ superfamily ATPase